MKIRTTKFTYLNLDLEDVIKPSADFIKYLDLDCSEPFRYLVTAYHGDVSHGIIDIPQLGQFLKEENDMPKKHLATFKKIYKEAKKLDLQEILF